MAPSIELVHSCLQDERLEASAVHDFCLRLKDRIATNCKLPSNATTTMIPLHEAAAASSQADVCIFLVSCGPDGSVHRHVRKFIKTLKDKNRFQPRYGVALLGHAVCKTSAEQMEQQVFSTGRRMVSALQNAAAATAPLVPTLETQVELVGPEEAFDEWTTELIASLVATFGVR